MLKYDLLTRFSKDLDINKPLNEYPRPTLKRDSYISLNGVWNYTITKGEEPLEFKNEIVVPFCLESYLSKVRREINSDEILWYKKEFVLPNEFINDHVIIHFDSIMQESEIYLNDKYIYSNKGGFLPFSIDIKKYLKDKNILIVKCINKPNRNYGLGKMAHERGGIWYTKTSGIWKTVWLESYNDNYIENIDIKAELDGHIKLKIKSKFSAFKMRLFYQNNLILEKDISNEETVKIDNPKHWTPDEPNLYDIEIENEYDKVSSYFAFRKFEIKNNKFYLNNNEIFINGLLDQGYFSDGIYTPATYSAYEYDIKTMKSLGFNCFRAHIKVEPEYFYYLADKLGLIIFQDFPNSGKFNFFIDGVLPTIGFKFLKKNMVNKIRYNHFINQGKKIIDLLKPHPSVVYYTIFNEGWGEFKASKMYKIFKEYNSEYIFDTASGWFNQKRSDVYSIHNYFFDLKVPKKKVPVILSEYGGYNLKIDSHIFNDEKDYGYHKINSKEQLKEELDVLFSRIEELKKDGLAGAIYTQVSDVEDETNGLLTYDRKIIKYQK